MKLNFPLLTAVVIATIIAAPIALTAADWHDQWREFVGAHCVDCHSGKDSAGDLDLEQLGSDLSDAEVLRRWIQVHDRVAAGEMPPPENEGPETSERKRAVATLAETLDTADRRRGDVVLRRLNRTEYENTVRDLFGIEVQVKQLLPNDNSVAGFDNVGEGLAVSAEAAQAYLRAADVTLDAVFGPAKKPTSIRHETNLLDQKTHDGKPYLAGQMGKMFRRTENGIVIFQSGYCPTNLVNFARLRAPAGTYRGTIRARAVQTDKPVVLRIYAGDTIVGRREKHLVGYYDVPPNEWVTIEFTDRLVENSGTFQPKCYGTKDTRKDADTYPEPGIEIGDITIEGPLEAWPPASRKRLLGSVNMDEGTLADARAILLRVLPRAFRRQTGEEDVEPYMSLVAAALDDGHDFESSIRLGLKAILCSPEFLFLDESGVDAIDQFALASRLSYFLWSSMPDERLFELAKQDTLFRPDTLRGEVERLLADPRAEQFTTNFVGQWLDLRDIDFTIPDVNLYPDYDELLRISMVDETQLFFREILDNDLSLLNFVDSDFTFLNQRLAEHYSIEGVDGQKLRRVELPENSVRGGVLTQASVLKVTANGTTSSPVIRGAWVLEKIQGQPVPPPPSNVAAVEPDIRGATTLREQLAKHRNAESCAVCHRKIDPAGFALENFDVIGGWRERYRTLGEGQRPEFSRDPHSFAWIRYRIGLPVDATGETFDRQPFENIREFKQLLLRDRDAITTGLTRKLATYSLGRQIGFSDRDDIDAIVARVAERDFGFRSLIHEIVQSEMFRRP